MGSRRPSGAVPGVTHAEPGPRTGARSRERWSACADRPNCYGRAGRRDQTGACLGKFRSPDPRTGRKNAH
eukprot:scaffold121275_cov33-Phaeocystis_antarctica.AAC.1